MRTDPMDEVVGRVRKRQKLAHASRFPNVVTLASADVDALLAALHVAKGEGFIERFDSLGVIRDRLTHPAPAARVTSEMMERAILAVTPEDPWLPLGYQRLADALTAALSEATNG
jgi:hypothetical protein